MDSIRQSLGTCPQHNVLFNEWVFLYFQSWVVVNTFEIFVDLLIVWNYESMKPWQRTPREPDSQTCKLCSERIIWPHIGQNHLAALSFSSVLNNIGNFFTRFSIFFSLISIFLIYSPHIEQNHLAALSFPSVLNNIYNIFYKIFNIFTLITIFFYLLA